MSRLSVSSQLLNVQFRLKAVQGVRKVGIQSFSTFHGSVSTKHFLKQKLQSALLEEVKRNIEQ